MSGLIGHTMYAILGAKAAARRRLPVAWIAEQHWSSYLAGAYLGCDLQVMPEAICVDTGKEVGFALVPMAASPLTGGALRPFTLRFDDRQFTPREILFKFYGRSHLTFGWRTKAEQHLTLPWDHLGEYCAAVVEDALTFFGPGERPLAYVLGWMTHLVGDGLIKSIRPGVTLDLVDGKYTPKNRPVQDLVTFHEIGRKELKLRWPALLVDLAETPVEPVQLHYMRAGTRRGRLGDYTADGWNPADETLLRAVLAENRRYLRVYLAEELKDMELTETDHGWECSPKLQAATGGLTYAQMVEAARQANFRQALDQIAEAVADLFEEVVTLVPELRRFPAESPLGCS